MQNGAQIIRVQDWSPVFSVPIPADDVRAIIAAFKAKISPNFETLLFLAPSAKGGGKSPEFVYQQTYIDRLDAETRLPPSIMPLFTDGGVALVLDDEGDYATHPRCVAAASEVLAINVIGDRELVTSVLDSVDTAHRMVVTDTGYVRWRNTRTAPSFHTTACPSSAPRLRAQRRQLLLRLVDRVVSCRGRGRSSWPRLGRRTWH